MAQVKVLNGEGREVNLYSKINPLYYKFEETATKHPAPGIDDDTHECELKWQVIELSYGKWRDVKPMEDVDNLISLGRTTSLNWVLAEQEKEVKTAEEVFNDYINIRTVGNDVAQNIIDAMVTYAEQFKDTTSSTRIAELEARVAELEGVLKEIDQELFRWAIHSAPETQFEHYKKASELATNALKK